MGIQLRELSQILEIRLLVTQTYQNLFLTIRYRLLIPQWGT